MARYAIMIADGCEEIEALTVVDLLRRADIGIDMISVTDNTEATGSHGITFKTDLNAGDFDPAGYDGIILPGGMPGTTHLMESALVREAVKTFSAKKKLVAAICAAPTVLASCGILNGLRATCYPANEEGLTGAVILRDSVVRDGNVITSRGMGTAVDFGLALISYAKGQAASDEMAAKIVYRQS